MIGAIAGDIIGSAYESRGLKNFNFPLFSKSSRYTDDTVLTVAVARAVLDERNYSDAMLKFGRKYPHVGYGRSFKEWLISPSIGPYNSWGNGAAMRVSAIGFAFDSEKAVLSEAMKSAEVTHNHPEGIKGAQATALSIYLARNGNDKEEIRDIISDRFEYDLSRTVDEIRPEYRFDVSCHGSVPESIISFLDSDDFESCIRNAVSLGGDTDTMACIAGGIAEAYYCEIPSNILKEVEARLPDNLSTTLKLFQLRYELIYNDNTY
jgi:ADP-ribosylglycohydrolase